MHKLVLVASAVCLAGSMSLAAAESDITIHETDAPFENAIADLEDAVVNRGYVIDYHGYIGEMLKRTAGDVAGSKPLYRNAEFIQFCSAVVSRTTMEAEIGNIAYCPYVLFAYEPENAPGKTILGFRRLPAGPGRDEVNLLLDEIVSEAADE